MRYLWDTNTASGSMSEAPSITGRLASIQQDAAIAISVVTRGEVMHGILRLPVGRRRSALREKASHLLSWVECIPVDEVVADEYARIKAELERSGKPVGKDNDLWIAATAVANGCVLVSAQKSFTHVPGLAVEDWSLPPTHPSSMPSP